MPVGVKVNQKGRNKDEQNKNLEIALKKFKKIVKDAGILHEIYDRMDFKKPSFIKREKNKRSKLKMKIENRRNQL